MKIGLISLTYKSRGHSKEYIDNLISYLGNKFNFTLFFYDQNISDAGIGVLDYKTEQKAAAYRKIIRRFFYSLIFYFRNRKAINNQDLLYFTDYEYLSLLIGLKLFFNKTESVVWVHSANCDGGRFYRAYKKLFFYLLNKSHVRTCVVNGNKTKKELFKLVSKDIAIYTIQYPSELSVAPVSKVIAKAQFHLKGKTVFSLIGMIRADKNYEYAIEQFAKSSLFNNDDVVLFIAGAPSGIPGEKVIGWLDKYGVKNYHLKLGYLTEEEMNYAFSASDCLVLPYGNEGSSQSGPLSLSRNYNLPAIVRGGGEIGEYVTENGVGLACQSKDEFIDAYDRIYNDNLSEKFSNSLKEAKYKYSWSNASLQYEEMFNDKK